MSKITRKFNLLLILSVGLSVLLSTLTITAYLLFRSGKDMHEKDLIHLRGLADSIEGYLDHAFTLNYQLSINPEILDTIRTAAPDWNARLDLYDRTYLTGRSVQEGSGYPLLTTIHKQYGFVELLFVQDAAGDQTARSYGPVGHRGERWWFRAMAEEQNYRPFLSHSYYSMTGDKPVASIFHPIMEKGRFMGIMGMDINFRHLQTLVDSYLMSRDMYAVVTDRKGVVIAHPDSGVTSELHNLITMTRLVLKENPEGETIDETGYHKVEEVSLDWPEEISLAVASAVRGESGFLEGVHLNGLTANVYYAPVEMRVGRAAGENYTVLLVHDRSSVTEARNTAVASILLFILFLIPLLFALFRSRFRKHILTPLEILIDSMGDTEADKFREIRLEREDEFSLLAGTYNGLRQKLERTNRQLQEKVDFLKESEEGYKAFSEVGLALSTERNIYKLMELILDESRRLTGADGGTLYLYDSEKELLNFVILHNETMNSRLGGSSSNPITLPPVPMYREGEPNHANVCSYGALTGEVVNIPDVYEAEGFDFRGMRAYDAGNHYHSQSMLVIPMKNMEDDLIGVIQLINARTHDLSRVIPFSPIKETLIVSLASQAAVALTNVQLNKDLENLFNAFIKSIAKAIDEKSAYTGGHIKRVVILTMMFADEINKAGSGVFEEVRFSDAEMEELRLAAWMHDIGKITTPESIMDKRSKLQSQRDGINSVENRYRLICQMIQPEGQALVSDGICDREALEEELEFLKNCNRSGEFLSDDRLERLRTIRDKRYTFEGESLPYLTDEEFLNLSIRKGTLNEEERKIIEHHAEMTRLILNELPFPKHLGNVGEYASMHHEKLDGSGYPRGLSADDLPLQARIIAVSDIFEALTAKDRPYREPMKLSKALKIMSFMVKDGHIDRDIFRLLIESGLVYRYAGSSLNHEQIDSVDPSELIRDS